MNLVYFDTTGKESTIAAHADIFQVEAGNATVAKSLYVIASNARSPIAKTLTKSTVRGGGRKPFRQKGTGNARQGSIRNPHYKGGGVAFGSTGLENYTRNMPLKEKRLALFSALSFVAGKKKLFVADLSGMKGTTKEAVAFFNKMKLDTPTLVYVSDADNVQGIANISSLNVANVANVNARDVLRNRCVVFSKNALEAFQSLYIS